MITELVSKITGGNAEGVLIGALLTLAAAIIKIFMDKKQRAVLWGVADKMYVAYDKLAPYIEGLGKLARKELAALEPAERKVLETVREKHALLGIEEGVMAMVEDRAETPFRTMGMRPPNWDDPDDVEEQKAALYGRVRNLLLNSDPAEAKTYRDKVFEPMYKLLPCILVFVLVGMGSGCAMFRSEYVEPPEALQITRTHIAPQENVVVAALSTVAEPVTEGFKAMAAIGSPVSAGFANFLSAVGQGLGNALSLGVLSDTSTTVVRVKGYQRAVIGKAQTKMGETTATSEKTTLGPPVDADGSIELPDDLTIGDSDIVDLSGFLPPEDPNTGLWIIGPDDDTDFIIAPNR